MLVTQYRFKSYVTKCRLCINHSYHPGQNLLRQSRKCPFFLSSWKKLRPLPNECSISPSPYATLFRIAWQLYTLVFRPKQLSIGGVDGANFSVYYFYYRFVKLEKETESLQQDNVNLKEELEKWLVQCFPSLSLSYIAIVLLLLKTFYIYMEVIWLHDSH